MRIISSIVGLLVPRFLMVLFAIFTTWFSRAFETAFWPIAGWIFLPYTTLAYMASILNAGAVQGLWVILVVLAVLVDLGAIGGSSRDFS